MTQLGSDRMAMAKMLFAVLAAPTDQRAVSDETDANNGLPVWYQDAVGNPVFQCTGAEMCGAESPVEDIELAPAEVIYWAGEASIPVGRKGIDLVMAVEGSFMNPDGTDAIAPIPGFTTPVVGSVILAKGSSLTPNAAYRITHPYGKMTVRTDNTGKFRRVIEHGCDIEARQTCDFSLALGSPIFGNFLRLDTGAPSGYYGDPEVAHTVVGSLLKDEQGKLQNYLKVEMLRPGKPPILIGKTARFSITGQEPQEP